MGLYRSHSQEQLHFCQVSLRFRPFVRVCVLLRSSTYFFLLGRCIYLISYIPLHYFFQFLKHQQLDRIFLERFKQLILSLFFITFAHVLNCEASTEFPCSKQDGATIFSLKSCWLKVCSPHLLLPLECMRVCVCVSADLNEKEKERGKRKN